jgi:hypothetical protein
MAWRGVGRVWKYKIRKTKDGHLWDYKEKYNLKTWKEGATMLRNLRNW